MHARNMRDSPSSRPRATWMADYYHTSREHVKSIKAMQDKAARRAERRTELADLSAEQPLNLLRIDARPVRLFRNTEQHRAAESLEGMLPWNGDQDNLIDRFDGRALLDFYREPVPRRTPKSEDELQLEEIVAFEAYRDLVKLLQRGLDARAGIEAAQQENILLRAQARTAAAAAAGGSSSKQKQSLPTPAGTGAYGAVGFAYDTSAAVASDEDGSSASESSDDSLAGPALDEEDVDNLAANLGIDHFSSMLRRAEKQELEFASGNVKRAKRMFSRKKAAQRAKRMAGMGLEAIPRETFFKPSTTTALAAATRDRVERARELCRRRSPSYGSSPSRSRSQSQSPRRRRETRPKTEFITSFSDLQPRRSGEQSRRHERSNAPSNAGTSHRHESFLDALPSRIDPSVDGGPVSLPASGVVMQGRRASDRDFRDTHIYGGDRPGHDSGKRKDAPLPVKVAGGKETPMERLKRLRTAQLNKTFQKDVLTTTQKKAVEERDRSARLQIERAAYAGRRGSPAPRDDDSPQNRYSVSPSREY